MRNWHINITPVWLVRAILAAGAAVCACLGRGDELFHLGVILLFTVLF